VPAIAATVYVSPDGNDANSGLARTASPTGGPFASIKRALAYIQRVDAAGASRQAHRIIIRPGTYALSEPLLLSAPDARSTASALSIEAEIPGTVVVSGGRRLGAFSDAVKYWRQTVSVPGGFHMLWINERLAVRARSPNGGRFYTGGENVVSTVSGNGACLGDSANQRGKEINRRSLVLAPEAHRELARHTRNGADGAVLRAMHLWTSGAYLITGFDMATGKIDISPDSAWPFFCFESNQRFALENLPGMLDEPGEWWLSHAGELRYMPFAGQKKESLNAVAPQLPNLIAIAGKKENPVQNITFRGVRFHYSAARTAPFSDAQAAVSVPAAITIDYARNIQFDDCAFEFIGGYALWFRDGVRDSAVRRSLFRELGAGAVRIGNTAVPAETDAGTRAITVENNWIGDGGKAFPGGVGIWIGQSGDNRIAHNELGWLAYSGISVGWTWGFGAANAPRNRIESNFLHDVGQGMLSDLAAVYMLGLSEGSVVRGNRIEHVFSFAQKDSGATAWGIYLDEGSSDVLVEQNLVSGTTGGGFHLHYGNQNIVRNNIFADGKLAQARRSKKSDGTLVFERNVLIAEEGVFYSGEWQDAGVQTRRNLLFRKKGGFQFRGQTLDMLKSKGLERESVEIERPLCLDGYCRIATEEAARTGFKEFSVADAGIVERGALLTGWLKQTANVGRTADSSPRKAR
jgi:parallel beta-helix repeat protein